MTPSSRGQNGFPELYYNFVIKRKATNAFIVFLLPLFLMAVLLFSALLTVTASRDLASVHGFNTSAVLATCSVLFFAILLAHIQLRQQFAGSSIVYMEYFYFLMYGYLVVVGANTYLFSIKAAHSLKIVQYQDNLIPKILYWPLLLLSMLAITAYVVWDARVERERLPHACSTWSGASSEQARPGPQTQVPLSGDFPHVRPSELSSCASPKRRLYAATGDKSSSCV